MNPSTEKKSESALLSLQLLTQFTSSDIRELSILNTDLKLLGELIRREFLQLENYKTHFNLTLLPKAKLSESHIKSKKLYLDELTKQLKITISETKKFVLDRKIKVAKFDLDYFLEQHTAFLEGLKYFKYAYIKRGEYLLKLQKEYTFLDLLINSFV